MGICLTFHLYQCTPLWTVIIQVVMVTLKPCHLHTFKCHVIFKALLVIIENIKFSPSNILDPVAWESLCLTLHVFSVLNMDSASYNKLQQTYNIAPMLSEKAQLALPLMTFWFVILKCFKRMKILWNVYICMISGGIIC